MNPDLTARLRAVFIEELDEQTRVLAPDLLALERDPSNADHLKSLFRVVHTLKGAARAVGVTPIERLCHSLESMLVPARDKRIELGGEHFAVLYAAADVLAAAARQMRADEPLNADVFQEIERRVVALTGHPPRSRSATPAPSTPAPSPEAADPPKPARDVPTATSANEQVSPSLRIAPEKLDRVLSATDDLRMAIGRMQAQGTAFDALEERASRLERAWRSSHTTRGDPATASETQAVEVLGELVAAVARQAARLAQLASEDRRRLTQISGEVSDRARRLRMRPFREICEALPRAARDVAAERSREVELRIEGADVEADRAVLDALREPLLHLVRNAVDHGIEDPAARVAAGKRRAGLVTVRAEVRAQQLLVSVADDGAGIDTDALRATAGGSRAREDRDLGALIFQNGVTTRQEPTPISGRGIGLDLVRTAVQRIGGNVALDWKRGAGTTFVLECPLTLAEIRVVLVAVGTHTFALPIANVVRLLRVQRDTLKRAEGRTVLPLDDRVVDVARLASILGPPYAEGALPERIPVAVLEAAGRRLALVVDGLVDEREVTVRPVDGPEGGSLLAGATLLPDRGVAPLLNVAAVIAAADGARPLDASGAADTPTSTRATILVADDSITTRALEQSMLEAAGYEVITAVDGRNAWQMLQDRGADLVVSDVEMPGLDGFGLCRAIRSSPRFARLPVVLVTALEREEHRAAGLAAGADAYIGKSSFDQRTLLDVVRQFLG